MHLVLDPICHLDADCVLPSVTPDFGLQPPETSTIRVSLMLVCSCGLCSSWKKKFQKEMEELGFPWPGRNRSSLFQREQCIVDGLRRNWLPSEEKAYDVAHRLTSYFLFCGEEAIVANTTRAFLARSPFQRDQWILGHAQRLDRARATDEVAELVA